MESISIVDSTYARPLGWAEEGGKRAFAHVRTITQRFGSRGSATKAEAATAVYIQQCLAASGVADIRLQSFIGLRSMWLFLSLVFGLAVTGHMAFFLLRVPLAIWTAWTVAALFFCAASLLLWREPFRRGGWLCRYLPCGASQNVVAVIPPSGEVRRRIVLIAHQDSSRSLIWFASNALTAIYELGARIALYGLVAAPLCYAMALLTPWKGFVWLGIVMGLVHFIGWFSGMTADLGPYSPGANDGASGMGVLLALAEDLQRTPLLETEIWFLFSGCSQTDGAGMLHFLADYEESLKSALFIDLAAVGIGNSLAYLHSQGNWPRRYIHPEVENLLSKLEQDVETATEMGNDTISYLQIRPWDTGSLTVSLDTQLIWAHGLRGLCLISLTRERRFGIRVPPEWRRLTDTADHIEISALSLAYAAVWSLIRP